MDKTNELVDTVHSAAASSTAEGEVVEVDTEKHQHADVALGFLEQHGEITYTAEEEKAVLRKIDWRLMPLMFTSYMIVYMDKSILGQAAIYGLNTDLKFVGQDYSWCSSLFYFGFLIFQPVGAWALTHFPVGKFVAVASILWAIVLFITPAAHNFGGMAAMRVLLGIAEGGVAPAFVLLTGTWYTQAEIPIRICIWFCGNGTAIILQSLISYGIGHIDTGIATWRWFYIIFGLVALLWAVVVWFFMPDTMLTANFLNDREKAVAVERIRRNRTGIANPEFKKHQMIEAVLDVKNWWSFFYTIVWMIPMTAIASFGSLVIKGFGFGTFESSLLNMPLGAVENIGLLTAGYVSLKFKDTRCLMMVVCNVPAVIGAALINYLPSTNLTGRLIGFYLTSFSNGTLPMLWAFQNSNTSGHTKRTVTNAMMMLAYSVGFIVGPQFFLGKEAPTYPTAFKTMFICFVISLVAPITYWAYMVYLNKQKSRKLANSGEGNVVVRNEEFLDMTDKEQPHFVYVK